MSSKNQSLAVRFRPMCFDDLCEQESIKTILTEQVNSRTFKQAYCFTGASGCGKTTSARIFANMINNNKGNPIELDCASNGGVDQIREIGENAKKKALDCEYKIFILDECHLVSSAGWGAFLKLIEEPPKYAIFVFCTTEKQKLPLTIINRCQCFDFAKISTNKIESRLVEILEAEGYTII